MPTSAMPLGVSMTRSPRRRSRANACSRAGLLLLAACAPLASVGCDRDLSAGDPFIIAIAGKQAALAIVALPDGRLLVAGKSSPGPADRVLVSRFLPGGQLDPSFGDGPNSPSGAPGIVITEIMAYGATSSTIGAALAVQADGKAVVAGRSWGVGHNPQFAIERYTIDGRLDATFGKGGVVLIDTNPGFVVPGAESSSDGTAVAIGPDGAIYVGGSAAVNHAMSGDVWSDFALVRLRPDGALDPGFGKGGVVIENFRASAFIRSLVVHPDGRVVVAGHVDYGATGYDMTLVRYRADGSIDSGFGMQGRVRMDLGGDDRIWSLLLLDDGKYLAGGQTTSDKEGKLASFAIARFDANGALDPSFGTMGHTVSTFPSGPAVGRSVGASGPGYWLAGFGASNAGDDDFALARYDASGKLDPCASDSGLLTIPIVDGAADQAMGLALQPDKTPVLAGRSGDHMVVARLSALRCGVTIKIH